MPTAHSVEYSLGILERSRERIWASQVRTTELKLRWRALTVKHCFHILPGESILELGAGSGYWTQALSSVFQGANPITAAVFSEGLASDAALRAMAGVSVVYTSELSKEFPQSSFDYVVGSMMLGDHRLPDLLEIVYRLLKPGGQVLFFESNSFNPVRRWVRRLRGRRKDPTQSELLHTFSHSGFTHVSLAPYDFLPAGLGARPLKALQAKTIVLEHMPGVRRLCQSMYVWARKPGSPTRKFPDLAEHPVLYNSVSFVIPCHNEGPNLPELVRRLIALYNAYIHEIIVVNDNSTDHTAEVTREIAIAEPRVKLLNRSKPNGVGRALRDGYRAASGRFILSMDCDFVEILPEFRNLFDAVAAGHDGAIGSRFSHDSVVIDYPFRKMIFNRMLHGLIKLFLLRHVRDVSNNLKLYRAEILKQLEIESAHFSANLETGLKPMLAGYSVREVPISWINRTVGMGTSSFKVGQVGLDYARALLRMWRSNRMHGFGAIAQLLRLPQSRPRPNSARSLPR